MCSESPSINPLNHGAGGALYAPLLWFFALNSKYHYAAHTKKFLTLQNLWKKNPKFFFNPLSDLKYGTENRPLVRVLTWVNPRGMIRTTFKMNCKWSALVVVPALGGDHALPLRSYQDQHAQVNNVYHILVCTCMYYVWHIICVNAKGTHARSCMGAAKK